MARMCASPVDGIGQVRPGIQRVFIFPSWLAGRGCENFTIHAYWSGPIETTWPHKIFLTYCHVRVIIGPSSMFRTAGRWDSKPECAPVDMDDVASIDQWDARPHSAFEETRLVRTDP